MPQKTKAQARTPSTDAVAVLQRKPTGGAAHTRPNNDYSTAEKVVTVMLATLVGVAEAAIKRDVPAKTIYNWLAEIGGAAALREAASDTLAACEWAVAVDVCQKLLAKTQDMDVSALLETLKLTASAGARSPAERGQSEPKTAPILIQLNNGRGGYDTLTVPAEAEENA